jgi:hypothetical protein
MTLIVTVSLLAGPIGAAPDPVITTIAVAFAIVPASNAAETIVALINAFMNFSSGLLLGR